ncbi:unnamed protein product [Cunninghamella blakesleeana]
MVYLNANSTTHSHWLYSAENTPFQQPTKDPLPKKADIVIIGGGITGLSTAYWLTKLAPEKNIVVLEARSIASGATGRNGGIISPGLHGDFEEMVHKYGEKETERLINFDYLNLDMLAEFLDKNADKDNGHFDPQITWLKNGTICAWTTAQEAYDSRKSAEALQSLRPHDDDFRILEPKEVQEMTGEKSFKYGALQIKKTAIVWAARIVFCLARAVENKVHLATFTKVEKVLKTGPSQYSILTNRGKIETNQVAYCTNAWTNHLLPTFAAHTAPIRNQVVSIPVIDKKKEDKKDLSKMDYVLSCNRGFQYFSYRPYDQRIIFGGMRDTTIGWQKYEDDDSTLNRTVSCHLRNRLQELDMPHIPEREWCGTMGFSLRDSLPFVGDLSYLLKEAEKGEQFVAAYFSGHGLPRTFLCGRALAQLIAKKPLDDYFPVEFLLDHPTRKYLLDDPKSSKL